MRTRYLVLAKLPDVTPHAPVGSSGTAPRWCALGNTRTGCVQQASQKADGPYEARSSGSAGREATLCELLTGVQWFSRCRRRRRVGLRSHQGQSGIVATSRARSVRRISTFCLRPSTTGRNDPDGELCPVRLTFAPSRQCHEGLAKVVNSDPRLLYPSRSLSTGSRAPPPCSTLAQSSLRPNRQLPQLAGTSKLLRCRHRSSPPRCCPE
ncbi:hypothetical protein K466DRAFT_71299 [Polyporus arcularius HHB13444]|uniref:Uncharacterized protein n=1 Tax=Polyporus arcularius HHB13444 TaxID=1314778 RepID=A0A5C3PVS5_9APHY|nr:hypothetical protein K466DRAFT_71299 [Polyporus arcularius HHB13444]